MNIGVMLWIAAILAVIPATIAKKRDPDVSFFAWYLYGFLLWIIALPHSVLFNVNSAEVVQPRRVGWSQSRGYITPPATREATSVFYVQAERSNGLKTFFAFIGVLALIFFGRVVLSAPGTMHPSSTQNAISDRDTTTPIALTEPPAMPVQAERLFLDYQRNEVAADQKYRDKHLLVTGIVTSVNKDFTDKVYLTLGTSNMFMDVHANLEPSEVAHAGELSKGEEVTVLCSGGMMMVGSPMLHDCVFHNAQTESDAPAPAYAPRPSNEQQHETVSVINAVNVASAAAATPASPQTVDEYEDQALRAVKSHWVIPAGVPGGTLAQLSFKIAADGRVYDAVVKTPSISTDLDQSCLDALNQVGQMQPTPTGTLLELDFDCHATR